MKLFQRSSLPEAARAAIAQHVGGRPRVLAWAPTADGVVAALEDRLVRVDHGQVAELGWHDVLSGGWDAEASTMHWTQMSSGERTSLPLLEPNTFPDAFRDRVEATFLFQQAVHPTPGKTVTITARRNLMDPARPVLWTAHPARGVRMDEQTVAWVEAELTRLRTEYAI